MAELPLIDDHPRPCQFLGPGKEVAHDRGPVVLWDERDQRLGPARLVGEVDAVDHVLLEDAGTDLRVALVVDVVAASLVLDERERVRELADVVVVGRHTGHQRIGTDRLGRALGQVPDPAAEAADANHSSRIPRISLAPSSEKTETTSAFTTNTATAAWTKTCNRSPRRTATMPAIPPRKMYVVNSSELPLTAPPITAMTAMTIVASEASSRIANRMAIAAVGRKNGSVGRPAVILSARVAPTTSRPIRTSTLSRCHRPGRNRQIQASRMPTTRTASSSQPAKLATSGAVSRSPR